MDTLINLSLLICGFLGALAAFGGKTWNETEQPLLNRVTKRGWLSLGLLLLALIIGMVKELRANSAVREEAAKRANLERELRDTTEKLRTANAKLSELTPRVQSIPRQVYSLGQSFEPNESRLLEQALYGGDKVEYDGDCGQLYLLVRGREYHLDPRRPARIIEGRVGVPMHASIVNRSPNPCGVKLNVLSIEKK